MLFTFLQVILLLAYQLTIFAVCECRPSSTDKPDTVNVQDTDDEFVIKKPQTVDAKYTDFLDELYRHDKTKTASKSKRDASDKIDIDESKLQFDVPQKPLESVKSEDYDKFLSELYRHDELKRSKRMIVFRYTLAE